MFAVIDSGTTNTRVYIISEGGKIIGRGERRVGVRNTSMTGSKDMLRSGVCEAIEEAAKATGIEINQIDFAITSGMITSEIGLLEIPHLIAPIGLEELSRNVRLVPAGKVLPLNIPILFIPGIRNNYGEAILKNIRHMDFMRGEETQMIGILDEFKLNEPVNVVVLGSHTKLIHANAEGKIMAGLTSFSGELYEAFCKESMIGKSLIENCDEKSGGYTFEEIVSVASEAVEHTGLDRCIGAPRFMQMLLQTDYKERRLFINTAIATDDLKLFYEFEEQGYRANTYILFGQSERCKIYDHLIRQKISESTKVFTVSSKEKLSYITVQGAIKIARRYKYLEKNGGKLNM